MGRNDVIALAVVCAAVLGIIGPAAAQLTPEDIEALREQGKREGWTFTVAENSATRRAHEDLCGGLPPVVLPGEIIPIDPCLPRAGQRTLPGWFDWRIADPCGGVTGVKDQGVCGACWAFSAIGTMESAILRMTCETTDLSEQWLVSCTAAGSCSGGHKHRALMGLTCDSTSYVDPCGDFGAVLEEDFPYIEENGVCECPYNHPYCIDGWASVGGLFTIPSVEQIKQAIYDHGPVAVNVYASSSFEAYDGGIYNHCQNFSTNHCVMLVGWNDADGIWYLRNSWGTDWGEGGYMRIPYGCSRVGYSTLYVTYPGPITDCNTNGVPDEEDIAGGFSEDCNSNGVPDECDILPNPPLLTQLPNNDYVPALDYSDCGYPEFSVKQWDDITITEPAVFGAGQAYFRPETWGGFGMIDFLVELADAPGGAEAGANVLLSTIGSGEDGLISWDFGGAPLLPGTYWLSVQATGGYATYGMVYWYRSNNMRPNDSEHYYHNPGGGHGHGTDPTPGSEWWDFPADLALVQHQVKDFDCNTNSILDECDIAAGTSCDCNTNGIPDECDIADGTSCDFDTNGIPDECELEACLGDSNCDSEINWRDIDYFVAAQNDNIPAWEALFGGTPTCPFANNDVNGDCTVNWRDIDPFVAVMNTTCP
ncbi:MAG: hypothetical protein KAY37_09570 [Phycisphaerae bacterium]|nr:hypothetical protein [Phycisphaerae bacterium]